MGALAGSQECSCPSLSCPSCASPPCPQMSFPIALMSARFLLSWDDLRGCWLFVGLSIAACALPALLASLFRWAGWLGGRLGSWGGCCRT